jgi:hypothetical protein
MRMIALIISLKYPGNTKLEYPNNTSQEIIQNGIAGSVTSCKDNRVGIDVKGFDII